MNRVWGQSRPGDPRGMAAIRTGLLTTEALVWLSGCPGLEVHDDDTTGTSDDDVSGDDDTTADDDGTGDELTGHGNPWRGGGGELMLAEIAVAGP